MVIIKVVTGTTTTRDSVCLQLCCNCLDLSDACASVQQFSPLFDSTLLHRWPRDELEPYRSVQPTDFSTVVADLLNLQKSMKDYATSVDSVETPMAPALYY